VDANAALLLHFMVMMQTLPSAVQVGPFIFLKVSPIKHQFCFPHLARILNVSIISTGAFCSQHFYVVSRL
jgi:hypothetical protein